MAKKLTLEERAAKKFLCPNDASEKERNSILAMQKAWIRVEQVRQEEQEKKKRQADRYLNFLSSCFKLCMVKRCRSNEEVEF